MPFLRPPFLRSRCLLVQARDDPEAFALFYDQYVERVLVYFTRRVLDAEVGFDLMSETFASAFEHRARFRGTKSEQEQGWLFAIARNELADYWRRGSAERDALQRVGVPVPSLTDEDIERIEEIADVERAAPALRSAMRSLPTDQAQAVHLRIVTGLAYLDIAERLQVSQELVRARVSRGLRALASELHHHLEEEPT